MFRRRSQPIHTEVIVDSILVQVTRKPIKNLNLKVNARTGEVRVSSPKEVLDEGIVRFIRSKLPWIRKHLSRKEEFRPYIEYEYISGEQHLFLGDSYILQVIEHNATSKVEIEGNSLKLFTRSNSDKEQRKRIMDHWYRIYLKQEIPRLIKKWEPVMGVTVNDFGVKKMKTRWGTCAIHAKRIWLNLELAKHQSDVLEYIVVHEMVHLLERLHNARFHAFMDQFLPDWRERDKKLTGTID